MAQPNGDVEDVQVEWMARLLVQGTEAGYTLEDDRFKQLFATAMILETTADTAIDRTEPLFENRKYEHAIRELTDVIDDGERYFAQHPKSLAEAAYGYTLARLYSVRAAGWLGASSQSHDATLLQRALKDADKALSFPAKHYEFINPTLYSNAKSLRDTIQATSRSVSDQNQRSADIQRLGIRVEQIKGDMFRAYEAANLVKAESKATEGIEALDGFFTRHEQELARLPEAKAGFGAYLATFRGMRGQIRYEIATTQGGSDRKERLEAAYADVVQTLGYPSSYFNDPNLKSHLRELQSSIRQAQNKKDGCFIATATYGSPLAPEIIVLRRFRDTRMRPRRAGRRMIDVYERYSPPLADAIAPHPTARLWVRRLLLAPVIAVIQRWFP